ncbi:hypothetical protein [Candidatus Blastococcus massiliensis]|uniref:hypothetical protein n=1 Tax=Candidatus Blastococcus massiliensis TaxID=1470358 RepID=UPI0004B65EB4|nr:hypothetical protein [Candidatus Blastococcus massiliensis]
MNRTARNTLAVAGMAGGIFFLGQAAASADTEANQTVTPTAEAANLSLGSDGGATAGNDTTAINIAAQVSATSVSTNANTGPDISVSQYSGDNNVSAGGQSGQNGTATLGQKSGSPAAPVANIDANTGNEAHIAVSTGDINGSGNVSGDVVKKAGSGGGDVTANQTVTPSATAKNASASLSGGGGGATAGNGTTAINAAVDVDLTQVTTNANTGPDIDVNQTSGDNNITCYALVCNIHANTGNTVNIKVETGDINNSANVGGHHDGYGHPHADHHKPGYHHTPGYHHEDDCPAHHKPAVAPAPAKRAVAPVTYRAATTTSSAQPSSQLAYTGAETSVPLTLGLIALGAGGALTLAGRRRSSTAAA